ncbi:MAG: twin-arginine translocase subunit TatC, partial [Rhodospirillaceae bacterium]|nr:twin-arginine translocase subunit TatC [Rhodospirillaceae bacterium]
RVGIVTAKGMRDKRRYAIVLAFVAAAILTPPDVISQIGLALPTILLYEISIISVAMIERDRKDPDDEADTDDEEDKDKDKDKNKNKGKDKDDDEAKV